MRLLIANDDGVESPSLWILARALRERHEVTISAPECEQSGMSQAFTFQHPVRVQQESRLGIPVYIVSGSPADSVKYAVCHIGISHFDLVLSGINPGDNAGVCAPYSGTVACAREAALFGLPAIALSSLGMTAAHYQAAAAWVAQLLESPLPPFPRGTFWNVNFPKAVPADWKNLKVCRASAAMFLDRYRETSPGLWQLSGDKNPIGIEPGTDDAWLALGHPTLVPTRTDSTHHELIEKVASALSERE